MKNKVATYKNKITKGLEKGKNSLVKNPTNTLYIIGGVISLYVGYKAYQKIAKIFNGDDEIDNKVEGTGGSIKNATISNVKAKNYAQQLLDASNRAFPFYGTYDNLIESVFDKLKNGDDYIMVFNAFGLKDYNGYNSPPEGFWSNLDSYSKRNLTYWLQSELSDSKHKPVYKKVKERIESAGFAF